MLSLELKHIVVCIAARRWLQHALAIFALIAFSVLLGFHGLADRALWSSHEGRAGQHAQLMLDTGRWGMPTLYFGAADYQKPPLYYWMVAAVAWLRGGVVDAWAVRLPAAGSAVLAVIVVYGISCVFWRRPTSGLVAGLVLASNLRFSWLARVGRIDMPLTLAVTISLGCFWMAWRRTTGFSDGCGVPVRRGWPWMFAAYLAVAVAAMLKGPVGIVLPLLVVAAFLAIERRPVWPWRRGWAGLLHRLGAWWGLPLVLVVAGPWFVWASVVTDGAFFKTFFLHHNWDRTLGTEGLKPEPIWYYVPRIFVDMFPWSVLAPAALTSAFRRRNGDDDAAMRFAGVWTLSMFAFLSIVRFKRHDYLLPVLPGLSLVIAGYWRTLGDVLSARSVRFWAGSLGWLTCGAAVAVALGVVFIRDKTMVQAIMDSGWAGRFVHETDRMIFAALNAALSVTRVPQLGCVAVAMAAVGGLVAVHRRRAVMGASLFAAVWAATFLIVVEGVLPALEPLREQRSLAERVRELNASGSPVCYYGREDQQLMFYLGPEARWLTGRAMFRSVITQSEPVFALVELERFEQRRTEWPEIRMVAIARNVENQFGTHRDPVVLVTNEPGWRLVESRRTATPPAAN